MLPIKNQVFKSHCIYKVMQHSQQQLNSQYKECMNFVRTDVVLISSFFLEVWTRTRALIIADSSSLRLKKLVHLFIPLAKCLKLPK